MSRAPNRLTDWIVDTALPFWAVHGFDARAGRFRERLDLEGMPVAMPHRAMVQARQIFVFAHAAQLGWFDRGASLAEAAMAALLRDFAATDGDETSFAFAIDPATDAIVSPHRDTYGHAFVLLAIAALYGLNGDVRLLEVADRTIRFIDRQLADPDHGGLFDALPAPAVKRQNPHMHMLEAYLFLERAAPGRGYLQRADALIDLFEARFVRDGLLFEHFAMDWTVIAGGQWEPGHHFEWVWLIDEYRLLSGETASGAGTLYASALAHGIAADGLIIDALSAEGAPITPSHRLWPHTEAIKAAATRLDDPAAAGLAQHMTSRLFDTFLDRPFAGGWIDHITPAGAFMVDYVPASSLYHLVLAGSVVAQRTGRGFPAARVPAKVAQ